MTDFLATQACEKCNTPLDEEGTCVTCRAEADGLKLLTRSGYGAVKEMVLRMEEDAGLKGEIERVPPRRQEEQVVPLFNLYCAEADVPRALEVLNRDWKDLLEDPAAAAAAERGARELDLDRGGEIECPACGARFALSATQTRCPECELELGVAGDASPEE